VGVMSEQCWAVASCYPCKVLNSERVLFDVLCCCRIRRVPLYSYGSPLIHDICILEEKSRTTSTGGLLDRVNNAFLPGKLIQYRVCEDLSIHGEKNAPNYRISLVKSQSPTVCDYPAVPEHSVVSSE